MESGGGTLQRRLSFPRELDGTGAAPGGSGGSQGLPIHYSHTPSAVSRGRKERTLLVSSVTLLLLFLFSIAGLGLVLNSHVKQSAALVAHHRGWSAAYGELLNKQAELKKHKQELADAQAALQQHKAQLAGASEQLQLFHSALQHKESTLAELMEEKAALHAAVQKVSQRAAEELETAKASGTRHAEAELEASKHEAAALRVTLERCWADYGSALEALQAAEAEAADLKWGHHGHGMEEGQHTGWEEERHPHHKAP